MQNIELKDYERPILKKYGDLKKITAVEEMGWKSDGNWNQS